jgi:hypothetical protein
MNSVLQRPAMASHAPSLPHESVPRTRVTPPADRSAATDRLIRALAADRLRDLRDDGVTLAYMARMYDVTPQVLEALMQNELSRARTR